MWTWITFEHVCAIIVAIAGIIDSYKYLEQIHKIKRLKTSDSNSRKFYLWSYISHIIVIAWVIYRLDWVQIAIWGSGCYVLVWTSWVVFKYYPNRCKYLWYFIKCGWKHMECKNCSKFKYERYNVTYKRFRRPDGR